ncbi:MAG: hypothetical protein ABIS36_10005 [Chryseolinea sp.]
MNILLIVICFATLYGVFALIAFKIVKVLFPDNESDDKRWRIKTTETL